MVAVQRRMTMKTAHRKVSIVGAKKYMEVNRTLIPLKAFGFCLYAGLFTLSSILVQHMKFVGLTQQQLLVIRIASPLVSFLIVPLVAPLVDRLRIHRLALMIVTLLLPVSFNVLQAVPQYSNEQTVDAPEIYFGDSPSPIHFTYLYVPEVCKITADSVVYVEIYNCTESNGASSQFETEACGYRATLNLPAKNSEFESKNVLTQIEGKSFHTYKLKDPIPLSTLPSCWQLHKTMMRLKTNFLCQAEAIVDAPTDFSVRCYDIVGVSSTTFLYYCIIVAGAYAFQGAAIVLLDAAIMLCMNRHVSHYGLHKLWQFVGAIVGTYAGNGTISALEHFLNYKGFWPAFVIMAGFCLTSLVILFMVDIPKANQSDRLCLPMWKLLFGNSYIAVFMFVLACVGIHNGFFDHLVQSMNEEFEVSYANEQTVHLAGAVSSIVLLLLSRPILHLMNSSFVLIWGAFVCSLRFLAFSLVWKTYWLYLLSFLNGSIVAVWVAALQLGSTFAHPGTYTLFVALVYGVYDVLGVTGGHLLAFFAVEHFGFRLVCRIAAGTYFVLTIIYALIYWLRLRHHAYNAYSLAQKLMLPINSSSGNGGPRCHYTSPPRSPLVLAEMTDYGGTTSSLTFRTDSPSLRVPSRIDIIPPSPLFICQSPSPLHTPDARLQPQPQRFVFPAVVNYSC